MIQNDKFIKILLHLLKEKHIINLYCNKLNLDNINNINSLINSLDNICPLLYVSGVFNWDNSFNWNSLHTEYLINSINYCDEITKKLFLSFIQNIDKNAIYEQRILLLLNNYLNFINNK